MTDTYKQKVDDFLATTGADLVVIYNENIPQCLTLTRANKLLEIARITEYTATAPTIYCLFRWLQDYCRTFSPAPIFSERERAKLLSIKE